jgi:hypothetical protein
MGCKPGCQYQIKTLGKGYSLDFQHCDAVDKIYYIHFDIGDSLKDHKIGDAFITNCRVKAGGGWGTLYSNSSTVGEITINYLSEHIISGSFNFTLDSSSQIGKIVCTNGNFDLSK